MDIYMLLLVALSIMVASFAGVLFVWVGAGNWIRRNVSYLVTFASGVFLVTIFDLAREALEFAGSGLMIFLGMGVGFLAFEFFRHIIPDTHHHHHENECDVEPHSHVDARRMLLSDALHNISDGVLLVPAFLVDIRIGITTAFAIFLHELVQETAEFFVLKQSGLSTTKALFRNSLVSITILVGVGAGLFISSVNSFVGPLIAFAAGGFLHVVFRDLLPSTFTSIRCNGGTQKHAIAFFVGILLMVGVGVVVPHSNAGHLDVEVPTQIQ